MRRMKLAVAVLVSVGALMQAGTAFAKPLSETQWKKRGNAICAKVNQDIQDVQSEVFAGLGEQEQPSPEQITAFVDQFAPLIYGAIDSIVALQEPNSLRRGVKKFAAAATATIQSIEADPAAAFAGPDDPFAKANKIARQLGLKKCADG